MARLYAAPADRGQGAVAGSPLGALGWTRQLEAIQRIAARLTRLASVEEVGATICSETRAGDRLRRGAGPGARRDGAARCGRRCRPGVTGDAVLPLPGVGPAGDAIVRAARRRRAGARSDLSPTLGPARPGTYSMLLAPLHYESRVSGADLPPRARQPAASTTTTCACCRSFPTRPPSRSRTRACCRAATSSSTSWPRLLEISEAAGAAVGRGRAGDATRQPAARRDTYRRRAGRLAVGRGLDRPARVCGATASSDRADASTWPSRRLAGRAARRPAGDHPGRQRRRRRRGHPAARRSAARTLMLLPLNGRRPDDRPGRAALVHRAAPPERVARCTPARRWPAWLRRDSRRFAWLEQLRSAADMDLVTGVHNHRYLQERLRQEVARSARSHSPLAVLMLDLDKFKPVNDQARPRRRRPGAAQHRRHDQGARPRRATSSRATAATSSWCSCPTRRASTPSSSRDASSRASCSAATTLSDGTHGQRRRQRRTGRLSRPTDARRRSCCRPRTRRCTRPSEPAAGRSSDRPAGWSSRSGRLPRRHRLTGLAGRGALSRAPCPPRRRTGAPSRAARTARARRPA